MKAITTWLIFFILLFNCTKSNNKKESNNVTNESDSREKKEINTKNINIIQDTIWIYENSIRFFQENIQDDDINKFKKIKIKLKNNYFIFNDLDSAKYISKQIDSKKLLGKGDLYSYTVNYLLNNYKIDVRKNIQYLDFIKYEDRTKEIFKPYFLMNDVIYTKKHLFLYSDKYLITYKAVIDNDLETKDCIKNILDEGMTNTEICIFKKTIIKEVYKNILTKKEITDTEFLLKDLPSENIEIQQNKNDIISIKYQVEKNKIVINIIYNGGENTLILEQINDDVKKTIMYSAD